jgi:hypothetical protein
MRYPTQCTEGWSRTSYCIGGAKHIRSEAEGDLPLKETIMAMMKKGKAAKKPAKKAAAKPMAAKPMRAGVAVKKGK